MRWMLSTAMMVATLGIASTAVAQPEEYLQLSAAGAAASTAGRHDEAYALFEQAHAVFPNARSFRAMGATAFQLRRYAVAILDYEAALSDERRPLTPEQRTQAEEELSVARRLVGTTRVTVVTSSASATIDGDDVALDTSLVLDPGPHELVVRAAGYVEQSRTFTTHAGEEHPFEITLDPVAGAAAIGDRAEPSEDPATTVGVAIPPTAEERGKVRVHVQASSGELALQRVTDEGNGRDRQAQFAPLCGAPCDIDLEPGTYSLGVSHGDDTPRRAEHHLFTFDADTTLELDYASADGMHVAGWVTGIVGLLGGIALMFAPALARGGELTSGDNLITFVAGAVVGGIAYIVAFALVFQEDHAEIRQAR